MDDPARESAQIETITTPELLGMLQGQVRIGRFLSSEKNRARIELIEADGRRRTVVVADPPEG